MLDFLFSVIVMPLQMLLEYLFSCVFQAGGNILLSILFLSFIVSVLCLPLYLRADALSEEEKQMQQKLAARVNLINKNFKGSERHMLLQTYYRQNNYHPVMGLRLSLSLLLQIPIFIAAYTFFTNLDILSQLTVFGIVKLSQPDGLLNIFGLQINVFPIIMTIINICAGFIYTKEKSLSANKMLIAASLFFLVLLYNSPSGLVLYWTCNNIFSLIKNVCLNFMPRAKLIKYAYAVLPVLFLIFALYYKIASAFIIFAVLFLIFISAEIVRNKNINFNPLSMYLTGIISCWVLTGLYIPSNIAASAPDYFMYPSSPALKTAVYPAAVLSGAFIFWGLILYYFSGVKIRKILAVSSCVLFIIFCTDLFLINMPSVLITRSLKFEISEPVFTAYAAGSPVLYTAVLIFLLSVFALLLLKNKAAFAQKIIAAALFSLLILSSANYCRLFNFQKNSAQMQNTQKNIPEKPKKYVKLSSSNKNVLIIFLDRAINAYLPLVFIEFPEIKKQFEGFTYYPNAFSYAEYTMLGYPPILGGYEYTPFRMDERKGVFENKWNEALTVLPALFSLSGWQPSIINQAGGEWKADILKGFIKESEADVLKEGPADLYEKYSIRAENIENIVEDDAFNSSFAALAKRNLVYYSILSILPAECRKFLYDKGRYHNYTSAGENKLTSEFIQSYNELLSLSDFTEFSAEKNTFSVINNNLTHSPALLHFLYKNKTKNSGLFAEEDFNSIIHYHVNILALQLLGGYMDFLRKNNAYDNTRIIIISDHGFGYGLKSPNMDDFLEKNMLPDNPLMLVKDFNSRGYVKTAPELMTNADVPFIALKGILENPVNPFTNQPMTQKDKANGILFRHKAVKWQPSHYLGKEKILGSDDIFNYVKDNPDIRENWITDLKYEEALKLFEETKGR